MAPGRARLRGAGCRPGRRAGPNHSASKFYPDSSDPAETLLRNAASHARDRQWSEAIDIYQRIIDQYGDKVAKLPEGRSGAGDASDEFVLFVDLRGLLPPIRWPSSRPRPGRSTGIASTARPSAGIARESGQRDPALLRRVVDQAFCSSWGDDALELLGDLAFQDGRFGEALAMYRQLVLDRPEDTFSLVHPDPGVDLARVAAKKISVPRRRGRGPRGPAEIEAFAKRFPGAAGALAGRKGAYATILGEALAADHLGTAGPAGQPVADLRRLPVADPGRRRTRSTSARCNGASRWSGSRRHANRVCLRPAADGDEFSRRPGSPAGLSPDRAGRPGHRLRRLEGAGVQPERSARRPGGSCRPVGRAGLEARSGERRCPRRTGAIRESPATR